MSTVEDLNSLAKLMEVLKFNEVSKVKVS